MKTEQRLYVLAYARERYPAKRDAQLLVAEATRSTGQVPADLASHTDRPQRSPTPAEWCRAYQAVPGIAAAVRPFEPQYLAREDFVWQRRCPSSNQGLQGRFPRRKSP